MTISAPVISLLILSLLTPTTASSSSTTEFFPDERDALIQLRDTVNSSLNLHANWTGPPCSDHNRSRWDGLTCSDWHVTHLVLEGIQLTGSLPLMFLQNLTFLTKLSLRNNSLRGSLPNLANLMQLETVFLSTNHFSGSIPSAYIDLPELTELELQENDLSGGIPPFDQQSLVAFNVSSNKLEGAVPDTPVLRKFPESSYANNSNLCGDIPGLVSPCPNTPPPAPAPSPFRPPRKKDSGALKVWSIALIAAAAVLLPVTLILIFICCYRRVWKRKKADQQQQQQQQGGVVYTEDHRGKRSHWSESTDDPEKTMELEFMDKPTFELDELLRAAAEVIGTGEVGITYKAMLESGSVVAVKRLKETKAVSKKDFRQQIRLLGNIKHENLAELISFYYSKEEKLIVYEYVPDGSLFALLHENRGIGGMRLDWNKRVGIIKEIAKGLEFLHGSTAASSHRVPHGNLKSSNVVINQTQGLGLGVKLTDYGLLPLVAADKLSVGRTPEFREGARKLTRKADVYCFGVVVLEIVTGKAPAEEEGEGGKGKSKDLSGWVRAAVHNDWSTDIVDAEILGEKEGYEDMLKLTEIALECTDDLPQRRPSMTQVLSRVQDINAPPQTQIM